MRRLNPYSLCLFFATRFVENGGDAFTLQRILGHTTPTMVKRYVHEPGGFAALHRRASPRDMLGYQLPATDSARRVQGAQGGRSRRL